jgi:hypothetical protein
VVEEGGRDLGVPRLDTALESGTKARGGTNDQAIIAGPREEKAASSRRSPRRGAQRKNKARNSR